MVSTKRGVDYDVEKERQFPALSTWRRLVALPQRTCRLDAGFDWKKEVTVKAVSRKMYDDPTVTTKKMRLIGCA